MNKKVKLVACICMMVMWFSTVGINLINNSSDPKIVEILEYRCVSKREASSGCIIFSGELAPGEQRWIPCHSNELLVDAASPSCETMCNERQFVVKEKDPMRVARWCVVGQEQQKRFLNSIFGPRVYPIVVPPGTPIASDGAGKTTIRLNSGKVVELSPDNQIITQEILKNVIPYRIIDGQVTERVAPLMPFTKRCIKKIWVPIHAHEKTCPESNATIAIDADDRDNIVVQLIKSND